MEHIASTVVRLLMQYITICIVIIGIGAAMVLKWSGPGHRKTQNRAKTGQPVKLTVSGTVICHETPKDGPGCVLILSNGKDTGLYHIRDAYADAVARYPAGSRAVLQIWQHTEAENGVYETI